MDERKRLRKLAGLTEEANIRFEEREGPIIHISLGGFPSNVRREASFSSFKIQVDGPAKEKATDANFRELDAADKKVAEKMLSQIKKLSKKFQADVEKVLVKGK